MALRITAMVANTSGSNTTVLGLSTAANDNGNMLPRPVACQFMSAPNGQLGTLTSSARYEKNIQDISSVSDALMALRPVTFQYKGEIDSTDTPQFGLIAEEVEKVDPDLVVHEPTHQIYTVRYDAVNAMLLNEARKQHQHAAPQDSVIVQQQQTLAQQEGDFAAHRPCWNRCEKAWTVWSRAGIGTRFERAMLGSPGGKLLVQLAESARHVAS